MRLAPRLAPLIALLLATGSVSGPDDLDTFIMAQIAQRHVPALSLAIVQDGRIVTARAYGVTDGGQARAVQTSTLFQAGSISKSVAALGALHLVEQHRLDLDTDVNSTLKTWKLPPSEFTATKPVTLRRLLSHTAGLTVHGFPGYAITDAMPTLTQVLDGTPPANTAPIRNDAVPDAKWNYSGGGYTIMQQMILDVTGQEFPEFMRQTVLAPLGMRGSSYAQPLPPAGAALTAAGHYPDGSLVRGRWHVYPEMAAAGLWTTPSDLARFAIGVQQAYAGTSTAVISRSMAHQMLTDQKDNDGLGVFLAGSGHALRFSHNGRDEGFDADMSATAETGQALVVMINSNDDSHMMRRIHAFIENKYHWPNAAAFTPPAAVAVPRSALDAAAGYYETANHQILTFVVHDGHLASSVGGYADETFIPLGGDSYASAERNGRLTFAHDASGVVSSTMTVGPQATPLIRLGPLVTSVAATPDPDPALTARVDGMLRALEHGGRGIDSVTGVTPGARHDFAGFTWPPVNGLRSIRYVGAHDVSLQKIERHGSPVARILSYRMTTTAGERSLLVYVTGDGLITDVDDVDQ